MIGRLHIVGLGADGMAGLAPAARAVVETAEVIIGGSRHHALTEQVTAERIAWPSPFDALLDVLARWCDRRVVVLVTGDPAWFSVGSQIVAAFPDATVHPHPGAFSIAAARMGWAVQDCACLSVHGRALPGMIPALAPAARLLVLTSGGDTPAQIARLLVARGYGDSVVTVLSDLGAEHEARLTAPARAFPDDAVSALNTVAIDCVADPGLVVLPGVPGLPDDAFVHDGTMTKREVRAITLARLAPLPGQLLWDLGAGCGSVAIEWMRAARHARAIALEPRADRRALIAENAQNLGAPDLQIVDGRVPGGIGTLPVPDAVFLGGGITAAAIDAVLGRVPPGGRLVANAVTLEAEAVLLAAHAARGGDLTRLQVQRATALGGQTGWQPHRTVTQWAMVVT